MLSFFSIIRGYIKEMNYLKLLLDWERWVVVIFTFGYFIGLSPIILGFIGSMYFRPCEWGLC